MGVVHQVGRDKGEVSLDRGGRASIEGGEVNGHILPRIDLINVSGA